jgi:sugar phosphate isomerase/epimerase
VNIAAQLYTVRDRLQDPGDVAAVLRRLRDIGYAAVEVAGLGLDVSARFEELLASSGLRACAAHVGLETLMTNLPQAASWCRAWGCRYVVVPSLPAAYHSGSGVGRFAQEARTIASDLQGFGLELAYHNHAFELDSWDGRTGLEAIFDSISPAVLKAELDTYWLAYAGADPAGWIRRLGGRVPLVHLKDMRTREGRRAPAELGEGDLDWPGILSACTDAGTEWLVVEQDESMRDPLDSLAISYAYLAAHK